MPNYKGRLELTWTNKDLSLLAQEDGSYEWLPASDYRVAEVRLLESVASHGETGSGRASGNLLVEGDALHALRSLTKLPEFSGEYLGKVKLVYLDPPFNTNQSFLQYDDALEHSVWLTMMRDRLVQVKALLAPNGSVWVHCDDSEMHRLRVVMDEVFGMDKFVATVVWQKRPTRENRAAIGDVHDYLLVYSPLGQAFSTVRHRLPRDAKSLKQYSNPNGDPRGDWRLVPITAQGTRPNQQYPIVSPAGHTFYPPKGRCWSMVRERYDELFEAGRIYFGRDGQTQPNVIRYLDEDEGLVPWTWWPHEETGHTGESKREIMTLLPDVEPFATPKPERLLHRIIHIATDPGDIVLDAFLGSATTSAVATKMQRRWVGVERSAETVEQYVVPRLHKVIDGADPGGVTDETEWKGGSGFEHVKVRQSMFESAGGVTFLADDLTDDAVAEATAAQLGFAYEPDSPFVGKKGRTRLAVIDGLVNEDVIRILAQALNVNEQMIVCGTAIDPEARSALHALVPGSSLRKIPSALLSRYRKTSDHSVRRRRREPNAADVEVHA